MTPAEKLLYREICIRFERPAVDIFSENSCRVICWNTHVDNRVTSGQLSGRGATLEIAMRQLLEEANRAKYVGHKHACPICAEGFAY